MDEELLRSYVKDPFIEEVTDLRTGEIVPSAVFLERDCRNVSIIRKEMRASIYRGEPLVACALCGVPVYPIASKLRNHSFRHVEEDGKCLYHTKGEKNQNQINALKYHGLKESQPHKEMKAMVIASLEADPKFSSRPIEEETRWKGTANPNSWRKPDVKAWYDDAPIAFEVQLSTTFLNVVVEREEFYLNEKGLIFWIFKRIDLHDPRLFQQDLFYNNNSNIFIVDAETVDRSKTEGRFVVRCFYHVPTYSDSAICDTWKSEIVGFDQLKLDVQKQRAYFFDYQKAYQEAVLSHEEKRKEDLREAFEQFWYDLDKASQKFTKELDAKYAGFYREFKGMGVEIPDSHHDRRYQSTIYILLSAKCGKVIGFNHEHLIQVAHLAYDRYKKILWYFGKVLNFFGHKRVLDLEDKTGKWKSRATEIRTMMMEKDPKYLRDPQYESVFKFLFPMIEINT
ncbi:MAG: hypothetical protein EG824_09010 [Deltaproteobacteria bacterium]|nr:hypothetical protein [Deltaproteobacteria bacterium]